MVDKMFLILLFATFAVCAFTLIMVGANVYSHTASAMNDNYEKRIDGSGRASYRENEGRTDRAGKRI